MKRSHLQQQKQNNSRMSLIKYLDKHLQHLNVHVDKSYIFSIFLIHITISLSNIFLTSLDSMLKDFLDIICNSNTDNKMPFGQDRYDKKTLK